VLVHGGPYERFGRGLHLLWADWAQWLATAGFAVLLPNPRGGCAHGNEFAMACVGDTGGADWNDVLAMIDAAVERGIVDQDRLGIGGWSQGGYVAAWAVTQTDRFGAAVMGAGICDWGMEILTSDIPATEALYGGGKPWDGVGPHPYTGRSPIAFVDRVTTPLLILHGENDRRIPAGQARGFHRALIDRGAAVELVIYPREGHPILERAHQIDVLRRVREWYTRHLQVTVHHGATTAIAEAR
jgi:dipeptidyl aminopeptidase/acylaminoacyl peptidase